MKKNILSSGATWLAELAIYIILGATPLFFNYFYPTSIDLSKIIIFKIATLLLLFAVVWRYSQFKIKIDKKSWKHLIPAGLLFIFLTISLFFSVDVNTSWFGSYDRQEGLVSWLFYGLWMILLILHLSDGTETTRLLSINRLFKVISLSGSLVSLYAISQILGWDFITWSEPAYLTGRAVSSFGQPNYLACWLVLVLPFSAYLVLIVKDRVKRLAWILIFISELVALLATGSRAAFFVFLFFSGIWLIWFLAQKNILSRKKIWLIVLSSLVILFSFLTFLAVSNKSRLVEFTDFRQGSAAVRLELWRTGWQAFLKKPLLGYGLENQGEAYIGYYKADWALYVNPNTYSDRAHNLILDILLTSGAIGLLFFIYFIYWVFSNLFKALKNSSFRDLSAFLIWSLAIYLISLLFNFSVTVTNIYFWLIAALSFTVTNKSLVIKTEEKTNDLARIILVIGMACLFLYGSLAEINRLKISYYYNETLIEIANSQYFTALVLDDYLNTSCPDQVTFDYYNRNISLRLLESLPYISNNASLVVTKRYLVLAERRMSASNFENKFVKAFILGMSGKRLDSDNSFANLSYLSPELPKIYLAWGDSLMFSRDYKNAIIKFEKVWSLLPDSNSQSSSQQKNNLNSYKNQVQLRLSKAKLLVK